MKQQVGSTISRSFAYREFRVIAKVTLPLLLIMAGVLAGCETSHFPSDDELKAALNGQGTNVETSNIPALITLREGDVVKISFPDSPIYNTTQQIRRDGRITMSLIGDVDVTGMTPSELEKKLLSLYASQLASKQVTVEVVSSSFPIYVTGMVLRPGKILSDHPMTTLEAVMEAGGFDYDTADLKDVAVIRREGNVMKRYKSNLKAALEGKQSEPFYLQPGDIVYVPERFSFF
jgi:polysaccharide export outer membrane protein